ncbi:MAG: hypothetical protein A2Y12_18020 [Planctomycetes bacterium GWF2_42_9]|nr:MAG: hypothetical protein A2Y12_18020 [Planctomycetes bacterium GWF2_42_9]
MNSNTKTFHNRRSAFTLVELLVVISIIAVLLAVLMPSLNKAKSNAKKIVCMSTIKQIVIGMNSYAIANNNNYPYLLEAQDWSKSWGTYAMAYQLKSGDPYIPMGLGLLIKYSYLGSDPKFYLCAGRDMKKWPANYLFDKASGWVKDSSGKEYPRSSCFNLRGWQTSATEWKNLKSMAVTADIFLNYPYAIEAHNKMGLNVGFSDGSVKFINGNEKLTTSNSTKTIFQWLDAWDGVNSKRDSTISAAQHQIIYKYFDTH